MAKKTSLELCQKHLFDDENKLAYLTEQQQNTIKRIRSAYNLWNNNPSKRAKEIVDHLKNLGIENHRAYEEVRIIQELLGDINKPSKDWHRYKFNAMVLKAYEIAEIKQDADAMQKAANTYAKFNQLDKEDPLKVPWDQIIPQLFEPTEDPTVLGIKPIQNIREKIAAMNKKYNSDIEDVTYESIDIEQLEKYADQ